MTDQTPQQSGGRPVGPAAPPANGAPPAERGLEGVTGILSAALGEQPKKEDPPKIEPAPGGEDPDQDPELLLADPIAKTPGETPGASETVPLADVIALAERAGIDAEALYQLSVPLGDGREAVKLGELKDKYQDAARVDQTRTDLEQERSDFQNEMLRSRAELAEVLKLLPNLPPELIARARAAHTSSLDSQRSELLAIFPEWSDDSKYQSAQGEILEAVQEYGFGRADMDGVQDHRLTKLLHDFAKLKQRVAKANAKAKELRGDAPKRGKGKKPGSQSEKQRNLADTLKSAKESSDPSQKVSAISQLLRGKG